MRRFFSWLRGQFTRQRILFFAFLGVLFVLFAVVSIGVWEWSNSPQFCAEMCHDVHPEEVPAYQDSYHAQVKCVECHMGRLGTLRNIGLKVTHAGHLPAVLFATWQRPLIAHTTPPASETCELCHWAPAYQGDKVMEFRNFRPDEENTEKRTYLILKIGGGELDELDVGMGYGIHWHALNRVEYVATDEERQDIRWVRATLPDGREVEYNDVVNPLSAEEIAGAEKHVMDCVDCHNRVGHPFLHPERLVDDALAGGQLSRDLPFVKQEMVTLLNADYANRGVALAAVETWQEQYQAKYPQVAANQAVAIEQVAEEARELLTRLVFEQEGISWQSFPDDGRHKEFPGCFRCHDGKHLSTEGESIRLHCNICHGVPVTVDPGGSPPAVPAASLQEPVSHLETNFMADHRFQASEEHCAECHGEVAYGSDDSTFCANSVCHGQAWPSVELDAAFPHSIELEGKHAEVWCHDCHAGAKRPEYECANCHQPTVQPHFGEVCEDCHTPEGFELADASAFVHPVTLEGAHTDLTCSACHMAGQSLTYECANCHQLPSEPHFGEVCEDCHTPASFKGATLPPELHPAPLIGAHTLATCDTCHVEGQPTPEYVCSNCHQPPENHLAGTCDTCHTPEGWVESAAVLVVAQSPQVSHTLKGMEDCLACHGVGQMKPAPDDHQDFVNEQCLLCHKAAP